MLLLFWVCDGALGSRNMVAAAPSSIGSPKGVPAQVCQLDVFMSSIWISQLLLLTYCDLDHFNFSMTYLHFDVSAMPHSFS